MDPVRSIPVLHLHYAHAIMARVARTGGIGVPGLLAADPEQLFKGSRPHRAPLDRARQLVRYARLLGLMAGRGDWLELTAEGAEYIEASDPEDIFATTPEQVAILRAILAAKAGDGGIPRGAMLALRVFLRSSAVDDTVLGRYLARRGDVTSWRAPRTFQAQGERYRALLEDAELLENGDVTPMGRALLRDGPARSQALSPLVGWPRTGLKAPRDAIHLLLKWSPRLGADTIERHIEVAEAQDAVWWGRVSESTRPGLGERWIERLRGQLEGGVPTSVFLHGGDQTWRARLLDITTRRSEIEEQLVPSYYRPETRHTLWVKLADFERVDSSTVMTGYVRAANGGAVTKGALGNQTPVILAGPPGSPGPEPSKRRAPRPTAPFDLAALRTIAEQRFELRLPDETYVQALAALESGKHVILTGPPGTAKTTLAQAIAEAAEAAGRCSGHLLTTATADWTTYETIGGMRPSGRDTLEFREGHFLEAIGRERWLLIDELNRSQFDRAFGQLFTVLSGQPVVLPYRRPGADSHRLLALVPAGARSVPADVDVFRIPASWRIVATMNVFDKTLLFEMSFALMRRFAFVEVPAPADDVFAELIERRAQGTERAAALTRRLLPLRALKDLGPAVFMDIAAFLHERLRVQDAEEGQLLFEAFHGFLLPQFEGIDDVAGRRLFELVGGLAGRPLRERLRRTLVAVLGLDLEPPVVPAQADDPADDELDAPSEELLA